MPRRGDEGANGTGLSRLEDPHRLNVLLLGLAFTTVWMIHLGARLIQQGRRQELAPPDKADYSVFRLGRD